MSKKLPELRFVQHNGAEVSIYPTWEAHDERRAGLGEPEYYYEVRKPTGKGDEFLMARFKMKAEVRGIGDDMKLVLILTAETGQPLQIRGNNYRHEFKASHAVFSPRRGSFEINRLTEEGYRVELPAGALSELELRAERMTPPKGDML